MPASVPDANLALLRSRIRVHPDWPQQGVSFQDLGPLLADPLAFATVVDLVTVHYGRGTVDEVVGLEARGFPYAAAVAYHLGAGFVPFRKPGKLPGRVHAEEYDLEYGRATLEVQLDALRPGRRVLVVDDVLATGGTASAALALVRRSGATAVGFAAVMELPALGGRAVVEAAAPGLDVLTLLEA